MKRINYKIGFVLLLGLCCRPVAAQQRVDVEKDLQYCHRQVARALAGLKKDGGWDYTRMPRNILAEDLKEGRTEWNCPSGYTRRVVRRFLAGRVVVRL